MSLIKQCMHNLSEPFCFRFTKGESNLRVRGVHLFSVYFIFHQGGINLLDLDVLSPFGYFGNEVRTRFTIGLDLVIYLGFILHNAVAVSDLVLNASSFSDSLLTKTCKIVLPRQTK